jgi:polysaccharide pyruvyl transferase WcaK-like protein
MVSDATASPILSAAPLNIDSDALALQRSAIWRLRWEKLGRAARRVCTLPELSIFGCYDAGNVGDLALGQALEGIAGRLARTAFDSPRLSKRLAPPRAVVLAGGGVVTARPGAPLHTFSSYVSRRRCAFSIVGVSVTLGDAELPEPSLRTLREAVWLSTRSAKSAEELSRTTGRDDIVVQPDIAFALRTSTTGAALPARRERRFAINVSPFLHARRNMQFVPNQTPSPWFRRHLPDQASWYEKIAPGYADLVVGLVRSLVDEGWEVVSIPLAPEDELFARTLLRDARVQHLAYDSDPTRVLHQFATAQRALVTRFHAHVFALLASTPFGSFAYSPKCSELFAELGLSTVAQAQPGDWVHARAATLARLLDDSSTVVLDAQALHALEWRAHDLTRRGVLAALDAA